MSNLHFANPCCTSLLHLHDECPRCIMLYFRASCPYCMSTLDVHAAYPCCLSMLFVHHACPICMSILHANDAWPCLMSILHLYCICRVPACCPCCKSMLHVLGACPWCMSMLHIDAASPYGYLSACPCLLLFGCPNYGCPILKVRNCISAKLFSPDLRY
jgi:hypothetical protein